MISRLDLLRVNTRDQVNATADRIRRTAAGPALVRTLAAVAAIVALFSSLPLARLLPGPPSVMLRVVIAVLVLGLGVGLAPRSRYVGLIALVVVGSWLFGTLVFGEPITLVRIGVLGGSLYLMHAAAAFAAVLPYDCVIEWRVLARWLGREGSVLGASLLIGLLGMGVAGELPTVNSVIGPIIGSVVAAGLTGLLAWHVRRRRT